VKRDDNSFSFISAIACVRSSIRVFMSTAEQPLAPDIPCTAVFYAFNSHAHSRLPLKSSEKLDVFLSGLYTSVCCCFCRVPSNRCIQKANGSKYQNDLQATNSLLTQKL